MKKKTVAGLIAIVVITSVAIFAGCVEEEEVISPTPTPSEPSIEEKGRNDSLSPSTGITSTVDEVLALPDEEIDLVTAILLISKQAYKDLYQIDIDIYKYRDGIDEIALDLSKKIENKGEPEDIIQVMNNYFFQELNFSYISVKENPKAIFPNFVLDEKKGDCLGLSILYLSMAERIELPLYGVLVPYHFFVRYEDNGKQINIETSDKGKSLGDDFYIEKFKIPKSSPFYLKSLGKKETIAVFLANIGNEYAEKGVLDEAISIYEKALVIIPNSPEIHSRLGVAYKNKGMLDEAISEQKKAIALNPNSDMAYGNLGEIYNTKSMWDEAILELEKAITINPNNSYAHNSLGNSYMAKGLLDQSILEFKKAITIEPNNAIFHSNLGLAYAHKGIHNEAISELKKALSINPDYAPAHYNLAVEYYFIEQYDLAIKHCDKAVELGYNVNPKLLELLRPYR